MPQQIELRNIALQAAQPLVHGVSLTLQRGRVLALVGGSGSGKSLTCAATLGILPAGVRQTAGEILADGKPVSPCALRGIKIATIMQNPRSAFNPLHTMHTHARETCLALGKPADDATLTAAIEAVGLENAARVLKLYPFEMSGGMRQRVMIAIAMCCDPKILIADEPTTALDVTIQAQIMELMQELKEKFSTSVILITHDLGVIAQVCTRVVVMYGGLIMEEGSLDQIFYETKHPYTQGLLESVPRDAELEDGVYEKQKLKPIPGSPPDLMNPPKGCPFAARCEYAMRICNMAPAELTTVSEGHRAACWLLHPQAAAARDKEV